MKAISELQSAGFSFTVQGEKISYRWTRPHPPDPEKIAPLLAELKAKKERALEYLRLQPGACESCPAAGYWDGYQHFGLKPGKYCFCAAYFLGKTDRPRRCEDARQDCPKNRKA